MLNKVELIGRVGRDPETRHLPSGEAVTNFTLATSKKWKDKQTGEAVEDTEWHRVSMFGKLAEIASKYVKKGSLLQVEGEIKTRKYTDKDGIEKTSTEIRGKEMLMLGSKSEGQPQQASKPANDFESDIPF